MSKSQTLREPGISARREQDATGVLIEIAAMDICSATFSIRERKGRRYRAQDMPRRTSRKRSDGWGAAAGCPYKCRIFTNARDCAKKTGVVRRGLPTHGFLLVHVSFLRGVMCVFTSAVGCIECRVIWKRKSRLCPGCIGFQHGHVLGNALSQDEGVWGPTTAGTRAEAWLQVFNTYDETRKQQTYKHKYGEKRKRV